MGRKNLFLFLLIIPILFVYNNCSKSSGDLGGSLASSSVNGGAEALGFRGKLNLEHFSSSPNCSSDWAGPVESLELDGDSASAQLSWHRCNDDGQSGVVFDRVLRKSYNTFLAAYEDKIYASPELHKGVDDYLYYGEFCFNEVLQMDVTIQYLLIDVPGQPVPLKDWVAVTMHGPNSEQPGLQFNGGYLESAVDGSKLFQADNGAFHFEISDEYEPGKKRAWYIKPSGTKIPFQCWFDPQI